MTVDEIMHRASELISCYLMWSKCPRGEYPDFEYYYCEDCLYIVRHTKTKCVMFVDAYSPKEAVETMIKIMAEG